jgi:hypothetical protein
MSNMKAKTAIEMVEELAVARNKAAAEKEAQLKREVEEQISAWRSEWEPLVSFAEEVSVKYPAAVSVHSDLGRICVRDEYRVRIWTPYRLRDGLCIQRDCGRRIKGTMPELLVALMDIVAVALQNELKQ